MKTEDFAYLSGLLRERTGLILTRDKAYLIENRLMPVMRSLRCDGIEELIGRVRAQNKDAVTSVIEAMMSTETSFFRDWKVFEHIRKVLLPNLIRLRAGKQTFRILCCGVSSGQEAYSLAMLMREAGKALASWEPEIIGVDLVEASLQQAREGRYSQFDIQRGLPVRHLLSYFKQDDDGWVIDPALKAGLEFRNWNIIEDLFPLGAFDVVLCRNVFVYFDHETKVRVMSRVARLLADDGALYLGAEETTAGLSKSFVPAVEGLGIYAIRRPDRPKIPSLAMKEGL